MLKSIAALAVATALTVSPVQVKEKKPEWKDAGTYRISNFCQFCNETEGFETASGRTLEYGQVAMNGVPFGTEISIDGEVFEVTDRVGVENTIDIFVPSEDGCCHCNLLEYKDVRIKVK